MPRAQIRTDTLSPDIRIEITDRFPNLRMFYEVAGLNIDLTDLYRVMRGEKHTPEIVQEVEQGYLRAIEVMNMDVDQLVKAITTRAKQLQDEGNKALDKLRELAGVCLYK